MDLTENSEIISIVSRGMNYFNSSSQRNTDIALAVLLFGDNDTLIGQKV